MSRKIKICKIAGCYNQSTTKGYCRFHYIANWSENRTHRKKAIKNLNRYVESIVERNPDGYISDINKDINKWQGDGPEPNRGLKKNLFDDFGSEDNIDHLINNLKYDDDY